MKQMNQLTVLLLFWAMGELLSQALNPIIRFPGTVLGMVLLFIALLLGWVREENIKDCSDFFLGNIGFFFVPVVTGLITVTGLSGQLILKLTAASVLSTIVTIGAASLTVQFVISRMGVKE